jgi:hypothetical protein
MRIEKYLSSLLEANEIEAVYGRRPMGDSEVEVNFFRLSHSVPAIGFDYSRPIFRFNVWSRRLSLARSTAENIITTLNRHKGVVDDLILYIAKVQSESEVYDDTNQVYQIPIDVQITYK